MRDAIDSPRNKNTLTLRIMNLLEIVEIRDKLKAELAVVEKFLEIAKAHGSNGTNGSNGSNGASSLIPPDANREKPAIIKQSSPVSPGQRELPGTEREYGAIASLVLESIHICPEKYTIRDVSKVLESINKPLSKLQIATALNRFAKRGQIFIHRRGKGSKPTIYKKTSEKGNETLI
jgi:hypothetical protein